MKETRLEILLKSLDDLDNNVKEDIVNRLVERYSENPRYLLLAMEDASEEIKDMLKSKMIDNLEDGIVLNSEDLNAEKVIPEEKPIEKAEAVKTAPAAIKSAPWKTKNVNKNWFKSKAVKLSLAAGIALSSLGIAHEFNGFKKNNVLASNEKTTETNNNKAKNASHENKLCDFNEEKYYMHPLAADTLVKHSDAWMEEFAKNGIDMRKNSDAVAIFTISEAYSTGLEDHDLFVSQLALGENYKNGTEVLNKFYNFKQYHEQIIRAKKTVDYTKLVNNKDAAEVLNRLNKLWVNSSAVPTAEQRKEADELIQHIMSHLNDYDVIDLSLMENYMTLFNVVNYNDSNIGLISQETYQLWAKNIAMTCYQKAVACGAMEQSDEIEKGIESGEYSIDYFYKSSMMSFYEELVASKNQHTHALDVYGKYTEITSRILKDTKNIKIANIDIVAEGDKVMEDIANAYGTQAGYGSYSGGYGYGEGSYTTSNGQTIVVNSVGDAGASQTTITKQDMSYYFNMGMTDCLNGTKKSASSMSADAYESYILGWNYQKQQLDLIPESQKPGKVKDVQTKTEDIIDEEAKKSTETVQQETSTSSTSTSSSSSTETSYTSESTQTQEQFVGETVFEPINETYTVELPDGTTVDSTVIDTFDPGVNLDDYDEIIVGDENVESGKTLTLGK